MFTKIALVYCYKCDSSESLCVVTAAPAGTCVHIAVSPQTGVQKPNLSLVKIRSVTAEIFLIWTHVIRTNVDSTNVTVTVIICSRWSQ